MFFDGHQTQLKCYFISCPIAHNDNEFIESTSNGMCVKQTRISYPVGLKLDFRSNKIKLDMNHNP